MDVALVFPPQWSPFQPALGLPSLTAYLRMHGVSVRQVDLNISAYETFFSRAYLEQVIEQVSDEVSELEAKQTLSPRERERYARLFPAALVGDRIIEQVECAGTVMRDPELFFDFDLYCRARAALQTALQMVGACHHPSKLSLFTYEPGTPTGSLEDIIALTKRAQENPFLSVFQRYLLKELLEIEATVVGISISGSSQLVPGLTVGRLLKESRPDAHVVLGGSTFTLAMDRLAQWSVLFGTVCDSVIVYEGETPMLRLVEALLGGGDLKSVPNLVYMDGADVRINDLCDPEDPAELPTPDFEGMPFGSYFAPYPVIPVLSCRGCYWGRCAFCSHGNIYRSRYRRRPPERVAEDIALLSRRHSARYFTFHDEAISPTALKDVCTAFKTAGLTGEFAADLRLDPGLKPELFRSAYEAGFRMFAFGLESGCDRVMQHMHKGTNKKTASRVLADSANAGMWNHVYLFFGFPTESREEAAETADFVLSGRDKIHSVGCTSFRLMRRSPAMERPDEFGITAIHFDQNATLDLWAKYDVQSGLTEEQALEVSQNFTQELGEVFTSHHVWSKLAREHFQLYLGHYKSRELGNVVKSKSCSDVPQKRREQTGPTEDFVPLLKSSVISGVARIDVIATLTGSDSKEPSGKDHSPSLFLWDLETGEAVSANASAATVLALCDGSRTLGRIAGQLSQVFDVPKEKMIQDCIRAIRPLVKLGMCLGGTDRIECGTCV